MNVHATSNDSERLKSLTDLDLNFNELYPEFESLMNLASQVSGTKVTQLNLLDSFTQWTVATNDSKPSVIAIEDCVCRYTVENGNDLEIEDLSNDPRFCNKSYVSGDPKWRYYYGIPIGIKGKPFVGTLCVLDKDVRKLDDSQIQMLKLIADEIVNKITNIKKIHLLENENILLKTKEKKIISDIGNLLAGIVGITELINDEPEAHNPEELSGIIRLINQNSQHILTITNEILANTIEKEEDENLVFNLNSLAETLQNLFNSQADQKGILMHFQVNTEKSTIPISKRKTLQVLGLLISNAIYISRENSSIDIELDLKVDVEGNSLIAKISFDSNEATYKENANLSLSQNYINELKGLFVADKQNGITTYQISLPSFPTNI